MRGGIAKCSPLVSRRREFPIVWATRLSTGETRLLSDGSGVYDHHPRIDQGRALGNSGGCDIQGRTVYWDSDRDAMMRALLPSEP